MIIFLKTIGWVLLIMLKFMIVAISTALISSGVMWVCLEIFKQIEKMIYRRDKCGFIWRFSNKSKRRSIGDTNENKQVSTNGDTNENENEQVSTIGDTNER